MTTKTEFSTDGLRRCVVRESACTVLDMPARHRPASELDRLGQEHVSDVTLIANILTGNRQINAIDLSAGLLNCYGSLTEIARTDPAELAIADGMTELQARRLVAALEVGRRMCAETNATSGIRTPVDVYQAVRGAIHGETQERFGVICLNSKNRMQGNVVWITRGLLDASLVSPREVFANAIQRRSAAIVLVHNHPSGDPTPSAEDIRMTRTLIKSGKVIDIRVMDHVVIASPRSEGDGYLSMKEAGLCQF